jgi:hypothetical protein
MEGIRKGGRPWRRWTGDTKEGLKIIGIRKLHNGHRLEHK